MIFVDPTLKKSYHSYFFPLQNYTFNFTEGHYKITFVSKRNKAANINIFKSSCNLT